jgi:hypothetical protein
MLEATILPWLLRRGPRDVVDVEALDMIPPVTSRARHHDAAPATGEAEAAGLSMAAHLVLVDL